MLSMVHLSDFICLLGSLMGLLAVLPVQMAPSPPGLCTALRTLNGSLGSRRRYMKHNFPINYTIRVHHEEIFKLSNITRLRSNVEGLEEVDLQRLWLRVNQGVLKKILRVLPERHPSRVYTAELESLFRNVEGIYEEAYPTDPERELPERVHAILDQITEGPEWTPESSWRFFTPKQLLENLRRSMHCLFTDCFYPMDPEHDYCSVSHWRKGRKKER